MPKFDVAVLGAGIAGLSDAALVSRAGKKVVLTDPGDRAGGCVAGVAKDGFRFTAGPNAVYGLEPGGILHALFASLEEPNKEPIRAARYQVVLPDRRITITPGPQETLEELRREYPREIDRIAALYRDAGKLAQKAASSRIAAYLNTRRSAWKLLGRYRFSQELLAYLSCLQTLDGILCHDGEVHTPALAPRRTKSFADVEAEMNAKITHPGTELVPMTLEGCVVRMVDTVAYIGRDIEDAIRLGLIRRSDLPAASVAVLGETNGTIVYHLVTDIIRTSHEKDYVAFSPEASEALKQLKRFNLERIYLKFAHETTYRTAPGAFQTALRWLFGGPGKRTHGIVDIQRVSERYVRGLPQAAATGRGGTGFHRWNDRPVFSGLSPRG